MEPSMNMLSLMDLLDLDEELVDSRLKTIMQRKTFTNSHLVSAIHLLQYKLMINLQEGTECENNSECDFIAKLLNDVHVENIDNVCKIVHIVLCLNKSTIVSKSEHLIQQILSNIDLVNEVESDDVTEENSSKILFNFKLCDSILDALIGNGEKVSLFFLTTPLENILSSPDNKLKIHFLTSTVPRIFESTVGYNIMDRIWNYLKKHQMECYETSLKVISCLSGFLLPIPDSQGNVKFESEIVFQYEFWNILLFGLTSNDPSIRKLSVYLIKRSIDCLIILKKDVNVYSELNTIFTWKTRDEKELKQKWDNFFILIDSLEEKQSNIVLPSLKLFDTLKDLQHCWLNCAFNLGFKHDNTLVRLKCIEHRLQARISSEGEALILCEALNDINLYDNSNEYTILKETLTTVFKDASTFINIFKAIAKVKWSPVPFYHLSDVLASLKLEGISSYIDERQMVQIINDIFKVPCNNLSIRKAIYVNISHCLSKLCKNFHWKELLRIYTLFPIGTFSSEIEEDNPFVSVIKELVLEHVEKGEFLKFISNSHINKDSALLYLDNHVNDVDIFLILINDKIKKIHDIVNRHYSDKTECLNDIVFLIYLFTKTIDKDKPFYETINAIIVTKYKIIIQYMYSILSSDKVWSIDGIQRLFKDFQSLSVTLNDYDVSEAILQLYKSSVLFIKDKNTDIDKRLYSIFVLSNLANNSILLTHYKHEMLSLKQILEIVSKVEFKETQNIESYGRLRNIFFEKSCEIVHNLMTEEEIKKNLIEIIDFVENVIECGGYGCLKWILKVMNKTLPLMFIDETIDYDIVPFINRMWKEIEELKSNNQYSLCIEEFVNLITQDVLLKKTICNNTVTVFCNKIIEYGLIKNTPLFYLVKKINSTDMITDYGHLLYVFSEILMYSPVPRKDQRITENLVVEISNDSKFGLNKISKEVIDIHFNFQIQYLSVSILSKIIDSEKYANIATFIIQKVDETFNKKQRYHGNSQAHRLLLTGLQHLILMSLLNFNTICSDEIVSWCIELLGKLPHQPSVRIYLEWYIALHLYVKKIALNEETIQTMKFNNMPLTSQFTILFWVIKHKIFNGTCKTEEYDFVMDTLLAHTMGQVFNIRLHAQYFATKLKEINNISDKYDYIVKVINKTFIESAKDKHFVKLKDDFFANDFDIVCCLKPCFIYNFLPKYCGVGSNENVDQTYVRNILKDINENVNKSESNDLKKEWMLCVKSDKEVESYNLNKNQERHKVVDDINLSEIIQKKYIPWKNMSEIYVYGPGKKINSSSELIVVACLIDKLPNLGGMARTSEVFGVKTYVVDSLKHLQDKQFQGLSVSAERWVNIEEVRPGSPLKDYLMRKKAEGYTVLAAEQTSTSCTLQAFKFPKKSLLLLGHEKEGIPCDLLPLMDHCVEIPQQGFVRSLNVHVTAAIFIWEYSRQNIL